ncbi:MAG: hypothetical protein E7254_05665 [Lachnospiraceae bacterium]|nr:hypothetical protein [Lachnospiraceae bacterium]
MSQEKIDRYKQAKYDRKNAPKKSHIKKYLAYAATTVVAVALIVYLGYSVGLELGMIKKEEPTTTYVGTATKEELESKLQSYDPIGMYSKYAGKNQSSDANASDDSAKTEEATTVADEK